MTTLLRFPRCAGLAAVLVISGCATALPSGRVGVHVMPDRPSEARTAASARAGNAAELAEAAFAMLNEGRVGGPDYVGAARLCLAAAEVSHAVEHELEQACYRLAARAALRGGDRALYRQVVARWEAVAPYHLRSTGELAVHRSIRDRLDETAVASSEPIPAGLRRILPAEAAR